MSMSPLKNWTPILKKLNFILQKLTMKVFWMLTIWIHWSGVSTDAGLEPVKTSLNTAPKNLPQFIHCKCKLSSKNLCGTWLCSCFISGLQYGPACGDCRGESCKNSVKFKKMWRMRRNGTETFLIFLTNFSHYFIDSYWKILLNWFCSYYSWVRIKKGVGTKIVSM